MKKLMVALLVLVAFSNIALAQDDLFIGIFGDDAYSYCYGDVVTYEPMTIYVAAFLSDVVPAITAAEFRVDNWIGSPGYPDGTAIATWNTDLVIGTIDWGLALAFQTPVPGPYALLGTIEMLQMADGWVPADFLMEVMASNDSDFLGVVDTDYNTIETLGGLFTFNCSDVIFCPCIDNMSSATESSDFSSIKALY